MAIAPITPPPTFPATSTATTGTTTPTTKKKKPLLPKFGEGDAAEKLKKRQAKFKTRDKDKHAMAMGRAMGALSGSGDPSEGPTGMAAIGQAFADVKAERQLKAKTEANERYQAELMARLRALTQSPGEVA